MIVRSKRVVAGAALLAAVALGSSVPATAADVSAIAPGSYTYHTAFTPKYIGGGSYLGILKLTVAPDGAISGYYRNEDVGDFRQIVGGVIGTNVWLDLGPGSSGRPIEAKLEHGKIVGGVYADGQPYTFVAQPGPI